MLEICNKKEGRVAIPVKAGEHLRRTLLYLLTSLSAPHLSLVYSQNCALYGHYSLPGDLSGLGVTASRM